MLPSFPHGLHRVGKNGNGGESFLRAKRSRQAGALLWGALAAMTLAGCGTAGGSGGGSSPPPPTPTTTVSVSPGTASLFLGQQQQFSATVTGNSNTSVTWAVNGVDGGNTTVGTISSAGLYTAPSLLPSPASITIKATSQADATASDTAAVTLKSDVQVTIAPASVSVATGASQTFTAQVSGSGSPSTAVNWSLTGSACPSACGTLATNGNTATYTAPSAVPGTPTVSIIATSVADPSQSAMATVTITASCTQAVSLSPTAASLALGGQQSFTATVCFSTNQNVTWSVAGSGCSGGNCGTVSSTGANTATYTAPASLPPANPVTLVATSAADTSQSASASITITASCTQPVSLSPTTASLGLSGQQSFTATICFSTNQNVTWSITGSGCSGTNCGTVSSTGANTAIYTAPASLPPANPVTLVATSAADTSQSASASITITASCAQPVSLSPTAATVALGGQQSFTASVCFTANQSVTWTVTGSGCSGGNCGTVSSTGANTATYTAPASLPPSNPVTLVATSLADTSKTASALIDVVSAVAVTLSPVSAEAAVNRRASLSASVAATTDQAVTWTVDGVTNGNATVGEICLAGSSPCSPPSGPVAGTVDYLAPAAVPSPAGVYVTATAAADTSRSATGEVGVVAHPSVALSPGNSVVAPSGTVEFAATVYATQNTGVNWQVACAGGGSACGAITSSGVYTAPASAPSPNVVTVTATSQDDATESASATVALTSAVAISGISPASVTAGATNGFTLAVSGYDFVPTSPGPGTTLLVGGSSRTTTCASATACTVTIDPADVAGAGTVTIQARNPDGTLSNTIPLVAAAADGPASVVSLSANQPVGGMEDVTAVQPTTDGGTSGPMTVLLFGLVDTGSNTCNVTESTITLARPSSGSTAYSVCLAGNGLDPSYTYAIAGSRTTDVTVSNPQSFAGSLVEITVTVSSTAATGPRTLIVTDPNNDRAVLSGAIDVE